MLESIIGGIAVPIFEQLWKTGGNLSGYVAGQIREGQADVRKVENILKASQSYRNKYEARHGQIKVMPGLMKEPMLLDSIYTAVKFLDERSRRYFATPDDLEQLYREQGERGFQAASERHDGMNVAKEKQYLMVLGGPGIGKSTFLKKLGLEALKGTEFTRTFRVENKKPVSIRRPLIPVFLELKTFRYENIDLVAKIAKEFEICGFPDTEAFTTESLNQGKLLLLLDGLDEVPTRNVNRVIEQIEAFATQYDKNTFVTSCRTAAYHSSFQQFSDVTIADFDDDQIEQFIQRWFNSKLDQEAETANHYWEQFQNPENQAAKELAQTPLLLTFLCLIYEREQELPNQRSTLYGRALNILLRDWAAEKRLERGSIYKHLRPEVEKELLSEIAYNSFEEDRLFFLKSDITDRIDAYLADTINIPAELDGSAVLHAIESEQGILVERATDTYSFSHLTLQEYLTAFYIVNNQLTLELASQHLTDQRWREVFLLAIGLMGRRGYELLEAIDQQARTYLNDYPKVRYLVQWSGEITQGSPAKYDGFEKIVLAIAIVIDIARAIAIDIARTRGKAIAIDIARASVEVRAIARVTNSTIDIDIDSEIAGVRARVSTITRATANDSARVINRAIDRAIDSTIDSSDYLNKLKIFNTSAFKELPNQLQALKAKMPELLAPADEWLSYADGLEATWLQALGLTKEELSLSDEEWKCLADYLSAYELLPSCQQTSIGISRKAWEDLEARLLTID